MSCKLAPKDKICTKYKAFFLEKIKKNSKCHLLIINFTQSAKFKFLSTITLHKTWISSGCYFPYFFIKTDVVGTH